MKRILSILAILALGFGSTAFAESAGKEITVSGEGSCLKCNLKQAAACQNAVTVEKGGTKTTYVIADNDVAKSFHEQVCKAPKPVTVTGTCKKVGDKLELTASKIEVTK